MYPLDQGAWGPTVRIGHLRDELAKRTDLEVISGYRGARRAATLRYAFSGRLRGLDGIYVESSTFLPAETDLGFLVLARALNIPVVTYVRDAYQLFPEYQAAETLRRRMATAAFRPMLRSLRAVSSRVAVPTRGLAAAIGEPNPVLLPPGAPPPVEVGRDPDAHQLLFVGDARLPAQGADRLIRAVRTVRQAGLPVELTIVSRLREEPPPPHPDWLHVRRAEGPEIHALLPGVLATVIPRPRSAYNDLALPIKLFDYLSYGRPLVVTDCTEQAAVVAGVEAGVVTADDPEALAAAIRRMATAEPGVLDAWSRNAHAAARDASWKLRADAVLEALRLV